MNLSELSLLINAILVFRKIIVCCCSVFLITNIFTFFIFAGTLGMSDRDSYFYAAIVAVVTVHVVLALFVYVAWNEGSRQWREGKQD